MLPGEASKGPGVEQEGREGSRQGCYSRCRSSLSLASPGALGHEWHGWLCLSSRQGPGPSQSHSVPAAVGKETWTLSKEWGWWAAFAVHWQEAACGMRGDLQVSTGLKGTFLVCIQIPWQCGWVLKPHYTSLQRVRFGWVEKNPNL